jgi:phosphatidate phosphatase APP1
MHTPFQNGDPSMHAIRPHAGMLTIGLLMTGIVSCNEDGGNSTAKIAPSNIKSDERVVFFPTYGHFDAKTKTWTFDVHGHIFEPEDSSRKRGALVSTVRRAISIKKGSDAATLLSERTKPFLVDNERGKDISIRIDKDGYAAGRSQANGHFSATLSLSAAEAKRLINRQDDAGGVIDYQAELRSGDTRTFAGRVHLISPEGISVISDIDDTIKISNVTDKEEMLRNTFTREFKPVVGMADLYKIAADRDAAFHYVSGSPWQLYEPLSRFLSKSGFPDGSYHLKQFRAKDPTVLELLASQKKNKLAAIEPLLKAFPKRRFLLFGDSGEQDPGIYGELARRYSDQVVGIFIRKATEEQADDERFAKAFKGLPRKQWTLFDEPSEIEVTVTSLLESK